MDLDHEAKIENPNKSVYSRGGQYAKEIKNGLSSPIALLIRLQGSETMAALGPEAYVKVDQKMFKLSLMDTNYSVNQETIRTQTAPGFIGGPGYGYYSPGFISSSRTLTVTSNICSGKLTFTKEIENEILSAKVLQYRFYSANDAVDLFVSDSDLELIKKFIRHKGEIQK
ncbi:hypothetical protein EHQ64_16955 [Leptospira sarikeiensis]|uniref:Uncharacterized protein n=1 Tax=Leptospira sarikeiensis TaxID=2484943 RepID=A0A4V3JR77_9LEPT|nr:hypothetical protein EHQ64_16955 [Leptospira sarikeiensis]